MLEIFPSASGKVFANRLFIMIEMSFLEFMSTYMLETNSMPNNL